MVHRTMGLPHKSEPKNSYCVIWVYLLDTSSEESNRKKSKLWDAFRKSNFQQKTAVFNTTLQKINLIYCLVFPANC